MNTSSPLSTRMVPIGWMGLFMLLTLLAVSLARWQGWHDTAPVAQTAWEVSLRFEDTSNGDVRVINTASGQEVALFSGEQGFLRGTLRAMARQRRIAEAERSAPLLLRGLSDGRLQLLDPTQAAVIDLDSFGPTNRAVFASLRPTSPTSLASPVH